MGVSTEVKNPTFSSSPCARDACRSGIPAPRKLTLEKWTTRQKPQGRPEGITIPKGDFLLLRVSLKTLFNRFVGVLFLEYPEIRSKQFESFSFGQQFGLCRKPPCRCWDDDDDDDDCFISPSVKAPRRPAALAEMVKTTEFPPRGSSSRKRRSCKFQWKTATIFLVS